MRAGSGAGRGGRRAEPAGRVRRTLLALLVAVSVIVPVSAFGRPYVPAPVPAALAAPTPATLEDTYAANRANAAAAARMAADHGDRGRAAADRAMAAPSRQLLLFDGRGSGRAVEVFGDLARADRIAVLVPGSDTSLDTYDRFRAGATSLRHRLDAHPRLRARTAVVAWLGYESPRTIGTAVLTTGRAEAAAPRLRAFVDDLRGLTGGDARISLLCHSYGTAVCARAADGLGPADAGGPGVTDIVLVGSPGTGADSAAELNTSARVWAARGADDWIEAAPHVSAHLFGTTVGFGTDPVSPAFGARVFAAGDGGHSDYFRPGSVSLDNLARIVLGDTSEVTRA
ncbi:hypothetical protein GCM10010145_54070 [Streptomyces ruber]|uniref:DUF1023 domain-containing protein n=2 Tax=Streptomyces TaxID=1883 RepID=A0A918BL70_9ACTN|nr:alpha/beta hydrolase [Streptomyces ruber]GGQ77521.1 hypothetical protein GCM10010145_54070 [Streptomyces ruber]